MRPAISAAALLFVVTGMLRAQDVGPTPAEQQFAQLDHELPPPVFSPPSSQPYPRQPYLPYPTYPQTMVAPPPGEPEWCESPYRNSAWRFEIAFIPTISHVSEMAFGDWEDDPSLAIRVKLGYEDPNGVGIRFQVWGFGQDDVRTPAANVALDASTFYIDFYKRLFIDDAELVLGAGVAGADLDFKFPFFNDEARFSGGGISVFGEGFYPIAQFRKVDIGSVARARIAILDGKWEDDGTPFIADTSHDMMTIMELAWGLQLRRRFGRLEDKYWYMEFVPEIQRWESASLPDTVDPGFRGTAINFGLAW